MLLLIVFSLTVALGVGAEFDCNRHRPPCRHDIPDDVHRKHRDSGKMLPSNEILQGMCPPTLEHLRCVQDYSNACQEEDSDGDINAAVDMVAELCDEQSDLRKAYVENVDCLNEIDIMHLLKNICFLTLAETMSAVPRHELLKMLRERNTTEECMMLLGFKPCASQIVENSCGEGAEQAVVEFINRGARVFYCGERAAQAIDELLTELQSKSAERFNCELREREQCTGRDYFLNNAREKHAESGNLFPSNEFVEERCGFLIRDTMCARDYQNACPGQSNQQMNRIKTNPGVMLDNVVEFCNEKSELRKGYAANVDCVNRMNLTSLPCFISFMEGPTGRNSELNEAREGCLMIDRLKPCILGPIENSCGEEARQTAGDIISRVLNTFSCTENEENEVEDMD